MAGGSGVPGLACPECGATYPGKADEPWRCDCGHPLEFDTTPRPEGPASDPGGLDRDRGLWAFEAFLPVERRVTLGEGFTPLVEAPERAAMFKLDYLFPSGSFKDRGATTTLSRAAELGVDRVLEDSSGNAGAAIAQYAARAGIEAEIYVPADAKASKLRAIERAGADLLRVEGSREDVTAACVKAVEATDGSVVAVGKDETRETLDRLHRRGLYVEPTCAVAPAALERFRKRGVLEDGEDVVVALSGSGLKG